jgi:hypothetical protein
MPSQGPATSEGNAVNSAGIAEADNTGGAMPEPLAALMAESDKNEAQYFALIETKISECMTSKGFRYTPAKYHPRQLPALHYGDVKLAKAKGFSTGDEVPPPQDADQSYLDSLSASQRDAYQVALAGEPIGPGQDNEPDVVKIKSKAGWEIVFRSGTCTSDAYDSVFGSNTEWKTLGVHVNEMTHEINSSIGTDSRMIEAWKNWNSCLEERGFTNGGDDDNDFQTNIHSDIKKRGLTGKQAKKQETDAAVASAECELEAKIPATYRTVLVEAEKKVLDENQATVLKYNELQQHAVDQAK